MTKTYFDFSQFQSFSEDDKVKLFVNILFEVANLNDKISNDILDDEIEELYFKTIKIIPKNIVKNEESLDKLEKTKTFVIFKSLDFKTEHQYGYYTHKSKLGYKVFLEFKRFIKRKIEYIPPLEKVSETLSPSQTQKIGLLKRSGIIEFLKKTNPKMSNNQLSNFIALLTKEPLKQSSINPHLTDDINNVKHPFQKNGSIVEIDLILQTVDISPQSDR